MPDQESIAGLLNGTEILVACTSPTRDTASHAGHVEDVLCMHLVIYMFAVNIAMRTLRDERRWTSRLHLFTVLMRVVVLTTCKRT